MKDGRRIGMVAVALAAALGAMGLPGALPKLRSADLAPTVFRQNWMGSPLLPVPFDSAEPTTDGDPRLQEEPVYDPPAKRISQPPADPVPEESSFPSVLRVVNLDQWRRQEDLQRIKEFAGEATLGLPLLVPQILLEEFIPRGLAVGPMTYLYRTSKDSKSMPLVVVDQAIFHEQEFLAQVQAAGATGLADSLMHSEKQVLRRSLMSGFRASYALPSMSVDLIMETAAEQGVWGYLLVPAAGGALLFLKGIDQKFTIDEVVKARVLVTSGRQWMRSAHSAEGRPVITCEVSVGDLPISLILSMDMSARGMSSQFIGLGTTLGAVEDLLGRDETRGRRPGE